MNTAWRVILHLPENHDRGSGPVFRTSEGCYLVAETEDGERIMLPFMRADLKVEAGKFVVASVDFENVVVDDPCAGKPDTTDPA